MDYLLIPLIFSIWAAISTLLLLVTLCTPLNCIRMIASAWLLFMQTIYWLGFLLRIIMVSLPGRILWWLIAVVTGPFLLGPIALYTFFKSVYNFGPSHRHRSIWEMLMQPVPDESYYHTINNRGLIKTRRLSHPNRVRRRVIRSRRYCSRQDYTDCK